AGLVRLALARDVVVSLVDVPEDALWQAVDDRVEVADRLAELLVQQRHEPRPERRHRARAADHAVAAVNPDHVARQRVRVAGDVRDAPAPTAARALGHVGVLLPRREVEHLADAAAGGAVLPPLVPDTSRVILPFAASSRVPPQASANGLEAGKSTCSLPSSWDWSRMSEEPSSPAATQTVTPKVAASWNRESMAR